MVCEEWEEIVYVMDKCKETMYISSSFWGWPVQYVFNLLQIRFNALHQNLVAQEIDLTTNE
jgi:hypothetical protein